MKLAKNYSNCRYLGCYCRSRGLLAIRQVLDYAKTPINITQEKSSQYLRELGVSHLKGYL